MKLIQTKTGRTRHLSDRAPAGDLNWFMRHGWTVAEAPAGPAPAPEPLEHVVSDTEECWCGPERAGHPAAPPSPEPDASDPTGGPGLDPEPEPELPAAAAPAEPEESHSEPEKSASASSRFRSRRGARQ